TARSPSSARRTRRRPPRRWRWVAAMSSRATGRTLTATAPISSCGPCGSRRGPMRAVSPESLPRWPRPVEKVALVVGRMPMRRFYAGALLSVLVALAGCDPSVHGGGLPDGGDSAAPDAGDGGAPDGGNSGPTNRFPNVMPVATTYTTERGAQLSLFA